MEGNNRNTSNNPNPMPGCSFWATPASASRCGNEQPPQPPLQQPTNPPPKKDSSSKDKSAKQAANSSRDSAHDFVYQNPGINVDGQPNKDLISQPADSWNCIYSYTTTYIPTSMSLPHFTFTPTFCPPIPQPMYGQQKPSDNGSGGINPMNSQDFAGSRNDSQARNSEPQFRLQKRKHVETQTDSWTPGQNRADGQDNNKDGNIPPSIATSSSQSAAAVENESNNAPLLVQMARKPTSVMDGLQIYSHGPSVFNIDGITIEEFATYDELVASRASRQGTTGNEVSNSSIGPSKAVRPTLLKSQASETARDTEIKKESSKSPEIDENNGQTVPAVVERKPRGRPRKNPVSTKPSAASKPVSSGNKPRGKGRGRGRGRKRK